MNALARTLSVAIALFSLAARAEPGFVPLFDGKSLDGWTETHKTPGPSYYVTNGVIASPTNAANDLITDKTFADYILRLDFRLTPAGNNGIGIRVPFETNDLTYSGNEVQVLDDDDPQYAHLDPGQYCGSLYKIFAARRGALNKVGDWNHYEITAIGRHISVALNGHTIVDGNLNDVTNREVLRGHPGMLRERGHIALLGHWSHVEFRNIFIKELPHAETDNTPPEGFIPLFDGHKDNLRTTRDYGDFELLADWKIPSGGEGSIGLRGVPLVQIWDTNTPGQFARPDGSGGLRHNRHSRSHPLVFADHPAGEWNRFRILVVGDKVHVFLNGQLVVRDTTAENYLEPDKPLPSTGPIELKGESGPLWFKNIYIREIPPLSAN